MSEQKNLRGFLRHHGLLVVLDQFRLLDAFNLCHLCCRFYLGLLSRIISQCADLSSDRYVSYFDLGDVHHIRLRYSGHLSSRRCQHRHLN
jgi:hypothetical protein